MNLQTRFLKIRDFLEKHQRIWKYEVLNSYPKGLESYPKDWINEILNLNENERFNMDGLMETKGIQTEGLLFIFKEINELTKLDFFTLEDNEKFLLPKNAFLKIKPKKQHEVTVLNQVVKKICTKHSIMDIIDIGGGVGNLSRTLAEYLKLSSICIEENNELIKSGLNFLKKYPLSQHVGKVNFINKSFNEDMVFKDSLSVGLHTCGPLAVAHLKSHIKSSNSILLNFGCCYQRLDHHNDVQISKIAKTDPLQLTPHSLTLAARGHKKITREDYQFKRKVKFYRYALSLYIYYRLEIKEFVSVGDGHKRDYQGSFSSYALKKINKLSKKYPLKVKPTNSNLELFYKQKNIQNKIKKMFAANIIRWQFGRVIEMYILLDRCLYLKENNQEVQLKQFFNNDISPRNIGILSNQI